MVLEQYRKIKGVIFPPFDSFGKTTPYYIIIEGECMRNERLSGKSSLIYPLKVCIFLLIIFGFGKLPVVEPITPLGMRAIGVFLGLIFAWMTLGLLWPSIIGLLALVILDTMNVTTAFALGWGSDTLLLILFMTILAAVIEQTGVSSFIAIWFVTRRCVNGKPWLFIFIFLFSAMILSAITSTVPAILICWSVLYSICEQLDYRPHEPFTSFMLVGIVAAAAYGLAIFPVKSIGGTIFGVLESISGLRVDILTYVMFTLPIGTLCICLYVALGKLFLKLDVNRLLRDTNELFDKDALKLAKRKKIVLSFIVILVFLLLIPSVLPEENFLNIVLSRIRASGTAMLIVATMCCIKINGDKFIDFRDIAAKGMQWDVIFLVSVVMPLSNIITSDETGISEFIMKILSPLLNNKSTLSFFIIVVLSTVLLSNIILQSIAGAILLPVFYAFALSLGIEPLALTTLLVFACHFGLLSPASSPMAALMHGNAEWISSKDIYKYGFLSILSSIFICCFFGIPYVQYLFR